MSKQERDWKKAYNEKMKLRTEETKTVRKIVAIIVISLILVLSVGTFVTYTYIKSSLGPVDPDDDEMINVKIPIGSSTTDIAQTLEEKGIINDALVFRFYVKFKNKSNLQAGKYLFSPSMTIDDITDSLEQGVVLADPAYKITIPEGKTVEDIAKLYSEQMPFEAETFIDKANDPDYVKRLIDDYPDILSETVLGDEVKFPLEGYLFAATYKFYEEKPDIDTLIRKMLDKTQSVAGQYIDNMEQNDFTVHESLTLASLIEKEAKDKQQRKMISGIFHNRLENDMPLQTDPTIAYALGEHQKRTLYEDLEVDSPYNTYEHNGLPAGPISNFSESALKTALNPEPSDYKYFLHDDEGNIHYAKDIDGHNENKKKYQ